MNVGTYSSKRFVRAEIVAGIVPVSLLRLRNLFCLQFIKCAKRPESVCIVMSTRVHDFLGGIQIRKVGEV